MCFPLLIQIAELKSARFDPAAAIAAKILGRTRALRPSLLACIPFQNLPDHLDQFIGQKRFRNKLRCSCL
jgi:hypothetical protein